MKRKIMDTLVKWREKENSRLPLLLSGARQVGKTYVMRELGAECFKSTVYVNFEADRKIGSYFETDIHAETIIGILEKYYQTKIIPDETLIIFDEIQMCERALTSLKYFAEEAPEYPVIAAGSLLGVALKREQFSFPVGKIQMESMYPMDFEEFLWAKGKEILAETIRAHFENNRPVDEMIHKEALFEYNNYCIIGGMPAAVLAEITSSATLSQQEIRQMLLDSYIADMAKYALPGESVKIFAAYDSLPSQLAKDSKKFQYKLIKSGARASQYGESIDWLIRAGIVNKCVKCTQGFMPPSAFLDLTAFKLYYSDTGIMSARTGMNLERLLGNEADHFRGIFAENYVACALRSNGYELLYWESEGSAEVDFLIIKDNHVIPVECKAGDHVKAKSLKVYREKYHPIYSIRISTRNFGMVDQIKSVPLYAVFCI
ncbi:MAG: ATP-binding protein [Oliverpabstia sp.]|nr:ATP-binding protein [Oliverpabstia sp.]